ncbi:Hypothetical protein D9617_24g016130 [Elsinoe fawcettii]|nr:Hypothetical protein D9617_24g016130 [Elsinoe fawcettii]
MNDTNDQAWCGTDRLRRKRETLAFMETASGFFCFFILGLIDAYVRGDGQELRIWPERSRIYNAVSAAIFAITFTWITGDLATVRTAWFSEHLDIAEGIDAAARLIAGSFISGLVGYGFPDASEGGIIAARRDPRRFLSLGLVLAVLCAMLSSLYAAFIQSTPEVVGYVTEILVRGYSDPATVLDILKSLSVALASGTLIWYTHFRPKSLGEVTKNLMRRSKRLVKLVPGLREDGNSLSEKGEAKEYSVADRETSLQEVVK